MSTFIFKINPEHCPESAFDLREAGLWEAGEFKVPWPRTLEGRRLDLDEIERGDECWIWLHVERRKDKARRSPGLVGQAVIDRVAPTESRLLLVQFSEVIFRKTAVLRDELEQHRERSNLVKDLLEYTTRRVAALTNNEAEEFERFINWLDDRKRRLQEQYTETPQMPPLSGPTKKIRRDSSAAEHQQAEEKIDSDHEQTDELDYRADKNHEDSIQNRTDIGPTEKESLQKARRGQGVFKKNVKRIESACRVTGVGDTDHLRASHIKPWRLSSDFEKLDGSNGLLLSPHIDHLFDRGFISFSDTGEILVFRV